jgi:hypothetical protein
MANLGGGGREKRTFNAFKERSKGSGLDTPPASALQPQLTGDLRFNKCSIRSKVQWIQCVQMFKTQKFIVSQKPNFCRELGCEVSGEILELIYQ